MNRPPRWLTTTAAVGAAIGIAGYAALAINDRRWERRSTEFVPEPFNFPGAEHRLTSHDGGTVFAIESSEQANRPTVVLGHGIAGDHTHWSFVGRRLVDAGYRVVVFDQRGHGQSSPGSDGYSLVGLAHDAATVIEQLGGHGPIVAAGHSMGGIGMQALARFHPDTLSRLSGLGLVATLPHPVSGPVTDAITRPAVLRAFRAVMNDQRRARVAMRSGFGARFTTAMLDQIAGTWAHTPNDALLGLGAALGEFSLLDDLATISTQTVVICGTRDTVTPMTLSEEIHAAIDGSNLYRVPGAGHMIVWEEPDVLAAQLESLFGTAAQQVVG